MAYERVGLVKPLALDDDELAEIDDLLAPVDDELQRHYPGDSGTRQPVHTVYVPADRFTADLVAGWGRAALDALTQHAPDAHSLAAAIGLDARLAADIYPRVVAKLEREPIEDLRVDFEDGYGDRPDDVEDAHALAAAEALVATMQRADAPISYGVRFKSLEATTRRRGLRTLDLVVGRLVATGRPDGFVVTLPKVTSVEQVRAMIAVCGALERGHGLPTGSLRFELQVETPQAVLGADGTATVARMIHTAVGRCTGLHYGTYDYSAAIGVPAAHQSLAHPAADHAKAVMQVAAAGTGVRLSDGSTNVLPIGDRAAVHAAWRLHARLVRRSLERAFAQGWDLHPAQLPTRYAATFAFYRSAFPAVAQRIGGYVGRAESGVLDEPATARALAATLVRGLHCGALDVAEVTAATGLTVDDLDAYAARRVG